MATFSSIRFLIITPKCYLDNKAVFDRFKQVHKHIKVLVTPDLYNEKTPNFEVDKVVHMARTIPAGIDMFRDGPTMTPEALLKASQPVKPIRDQ